VRKQIDEGRQVYIVYPLIKESEKIDLKNLEEGYLHILEVYFDHDCSIIHAADALYCHKNTLSYKLNKIKELLDYDILTNENRTNIMLSFYILRLEKRSI